MDAFSLTLIPDISNWNTENVINMDYLCADCNNLIDLPDLSRWNKNKVKNKNNMFKGCLKSKLVSNISNENADNNNERNEISNNFSELPNFTENNISLANSIESAFEECSNSSSFIDPSNIDRSSMRNFSDNLSEINFVSSNEQINNSNNNIPNYSFINNENINEDNYGDNYDDFYN